MGGGDQGSKQRAGPLVGAGLAFLAALSFGGADILVKVSEGGLTIWQIALGRCLLGMAFVVILTRVKKVSLLGRDRRILLASGISGVVAFIILGLTLRRLPLAEALVLLYLFPAFSALLSPWLAGERIPARDWLWVGVAFLGTVVVLWPDRAGPELGWGHLLGLASGMSLGVSIALLRRVRNQRNALSPYFYYCAAGIVISLVPVLAGTGPVFPVGLEAWTILLLLSALATTANLATNKSVQYLSAPKAGVILMGEVVMGSVLGVVLFAEPLTLRLITGATLILGGGALLTLGGPKRKLSGKAKTVPPPV